MGDGVRRGSRCQGYHRRVVGGVFAGSLGIGRGDYRARGFSVGGASRGRRAGDVAHALVSRNAPFTETALVAAVVTAVVVLVAPPAERRPWLALGLVLGWAASAWEAC